MLRAGLKTTKGPIALIGINAENKKRMEAGMPLDIDLKPIQLYGSRFTRVIVHYAETYEDVVRDMEEGGIEVTEEFYQMARDLDKQVQKP